jgi:hypothetical protein
MTAAEALISAEDLSGRGDLIRDIQNTACAVFLKRKAEVQS